MSDFQFNLQTPNPSGNSRGNQNQSPWILILFGAPFLLFGLIALAAAIHDPKQKNVSVAFSVGGIFVCVGLGLMIAGFRLRKNAKQTVDSQARNPDKPWLWRADWADGKIKSSALGQSKIALIMGFGFCAIGGVSTGFALPEVWQKHNYAALAVLFFPLAGLGLITAFFIEWRSQRRFGDCFLELAQIPVPSGGVFEGMIHTGVPLQLEHELELTLTCNRRVQAGKNNTESILWQGEKIYTVQASLPRLDNGTGIPVHFKLPEGQPQCVSAGSVSIFWRLEAKSKMRGPDFHLVFDLPVFKTAGAEIADTGEAEADERDPTAKLQASIEEIRRDENSKIKITDGPNGREFYFPAARNLTAAVIVTLVFIVWSVLFWIIAHSHAPIIFPILWGFFDALIAFGVFNAWFKSSRVAINSTNVQATNRYLFFSRTRQFSSVDVARFATSLGMQSGSKTYTDIKLITRDSDGSFEANKAKYQQTGQMPPLKFRMSDPRGVIVASSIANVAEANWLIAEMNKALGKKIGRD